MVDFQSYFEYGQSFAENGSLQLSDLPPDCTCSDCRTNQGLNTRCRTLFDSKMAQDRRDWHEEQYLLCPPRVLGCVLRDKQWAQLQVSLIKEIPPEDTENAWHSRLQLADKNTKGLLFDLVRSHISTTTRSGSPKNQALKVDDFVPDKGKGLVILLYGIF